MKIGMTSLTLQEKSVSEVIRYAKAIGLSGIEWGISDKHVCMGNAERTEEIKLLSKKSGLEIFSLGSYCYMETADECDSALETAVLLGAPVIRIWAGKHSPCDADAVYRKKIADNSRYMADMAAHHGISLGFEYHPYTLTETCEEALALIRYVNRENVSLYWQPNQSLSLEKNILDRDKILPYCVGNIHIQNYTEENGYGLLSEIRERLRAYFGAIKNQSYRIMIEFVKDSLPENLTRDAETLRTMLGL